MFSDVLSVLCSRFLKVFCKILARVCLKRGRAANTEKKERRIKTADSLGRRIFFQHCHSAISQNQKPGYKLYSSLSFVLHVQSITKPCHTRDAPISEAKSFTPFPLFLVNTQPPHRKMPYLLLKNYQ